MHAFSRVFVGTNACIAIILGYKNRDRFSGFILDHSDISYEQIQLKKEKGVFLLFSFEMVSYPAN